MKNEKEKTTCHRTFELTFEANEKLKTLPKEMGISQFGFINALIELASADESFVKRAVKDKIAKINKEKSDKKALRKLISDKVKNMSKEDAESLLNE